MYKRLLIAISLVMAFASLATLARTQQTNAQQEVKFCHRDSNIKKPYGPKPITTDANSIITEGHSGHTGPLPPNDNWGDIIPSFDYYDSEGHLQHFDGLNYDNAGKAMLENDCQYVEVTPAAVTFVGSTCENNEASYIIPATTGVEYYVGDDTDPTTANTYPVTSDQTISVKAIAKAGYVIQSGAAYQWSYNFHIKTNAECESITTVTPAEVAFVDSTCEVKSGSYTIPTTTGVKYYVNGSLTATTAGTYPIIADTSITVQAIAEAGYEIEAGATDLWAHGFHIKTVEECVLGTESVTPKAVTFKAPTCDVLGSYTIPTMTGIKYYIDGKVVASGTYTAQNGKTITVMAVAEEGYNIKKNATNQWTYTFNAPSAESCVLGAGTIKPTTLPLTSGDSTIANITLLSIAAGVITIVSFAARSIFARQF